MTAGPVSRTDPAAPSLVLIAALSLVAGVTDVTSFVLLGGFFSAHITGNLVVLAADVVGGETPTLSSCLAIPAFIVVAGLATVMTRRATLSTGRTTATLLTAQAVLLSAAAVLSFTTHASADPDAPLAVLIGMCAVAAMAVQNAYLHLVPTKAYSTAVMTGNLVTAVVSATELVTLTGDRAKAARQWHSSWPLLTGFIGGCLLGAAAASMFSDHAAVLPAVLAILIVVAVGARTAGSPMTPATKAPSAVGSPT